MNEDEIDETSSDLIGWWNHVKPQQEETKKKPVRLQKTDGVILEKVARLFYSRVRKKIDGWGTQYRCPLEENVRYSNLKKCSLMDCTPCYLTRTNPEDRVEQRDDCPIWIKINELLYG